VITCVVNSYSGKCCCFLGSYISKYFINSSTYLIYAIYSLYLFLLSLLIGKICSLYHRFSTERSIAKSMEFDHARKFKLTGVRDHPKEGLGTFKLHGVMFIGNVMHVSQNHTYHSQMFSYSNEQHQHKLGQLHVCFPTINKIV
jgi:hypothetical protein